MKTINLTLTLPEAIKLMSACNAAIAEDEAFICTMDLMFPNYAHRMEMAQNSIKCLKELKKKISEACTKDSVCYIAYYSYQDDHEIFGIYSNRADAEERCLSEYNERKGTEYYVEELTIL